VRQFYRQGFRKFKVKLEGDPDGDYRRVSIVKRLAAKCTICLDANQSYSAEGALEFLRLLQRYYIAPLMIEQPVNRKDWEGLKKVTRLSKVAVCADESVTCISDVLRLIREKAADIVNIKLMKFGLLEAREVARLVKAAGLGLMIGSMMEGNLAATAAAHAASGLGGFDFVDLDTPFFIKGQVRKNPYLNSRGVYSPGEVRAGIGIVPTFTRPRVR